MSDVTRILSAIEEGDPRAAEQLLPLVYEELRKLAAHKMAHEACNITLQPTALVHEAYLRLIHEKDAQHWNGRGHFFGAAAEAMRRILVDHARRRASLKQGGSRVREPLDESAIAAAVIPNDILALDEALEKLAGSDPQAAELVKLRFFTGLTVKQSAEILGISARTADDVWAYARAWLLREIERDRLPPPAG